MATSQALVSKFAFCYSSPFLYNESEYSLCAHNVTEQSTQGCFWPNLVSSAVLVNDCDNSVFAALVVVFAAVVVVVAAVLFVVAAVAVVFAAVVAV